ncbi:MAG: L-serine ammonia-lyase, iron-sulfur-dependent, subunit alpha [Clostridia bacterium]|nr:L-serine ammonia-lyase, iron-sulfur-dependent, subunit alpha [Clostridia bacterium]
MQSLTELYRMGRGPSSSHTMGPEKACLLFRKKNHTADRFRVVLFGSLAKTGVGHGTDRIVRETMEPMSCEVEFNYEDVPLPHPNTMELYAYRDGQEVDRLRVMSVGGGEICFEGTPLAVPPDVYDIASFAHIASYCREHGLRLWEYARQVEGEALWAHLYTIWDAMKASIRIGLNTTGTLPGGLEVQRKAKQLMDRQHIDESAETRENRMVCAFAFAVSEQNAAGERIVTAPTCGSAGVMPAVLYYQQQKRGFSDEEIVRALATGGIVGNLIKTNASISGSECGCQAEVGSACAMAAAALGELFQLDLDKIEYAAEIAIEHHLGLTCDPICGLVQIPCIERNAVAAMRAINAVSLASFLSDSRKISLDDCIAVMKQTGLDISHRYKETAEGGLATLQV